MTKFWQFVALVLAGGAFVLIIDTHVERQKTRNFAGVIAACANGKDFIIANRIVHCIPVDVMGAKP